MHETGVYGGRFVGVDCGRERGGFGEGKRFVAEDRKGAVEGQSSLRQVEGSGTYRSVM